MKYIKSITVIMLLLYSLTGCSYVSDYVEGQITNRASFAIVAQYNSGSGNVNIFWTETDSSEDFAGIEIYRSSYANDEYAPYEMIAYKWDNASLHDGSDYPINPKSFTDTSPPATPGIYFYRVGFIHWDDSLEDREEAGSGYSGTNPVYTETTYHNKTGIEKVSGYAKVIIP